MEEVASRSDGVHTRFKGASKLTSTVRFVNSSELFLPHAMSATDADGADAIDVVVRRRKAEISRLTLAARTAAARCGRVEAELLSSADEGSPELGSSDLFGVVDTMLGNAMRAATAAVAQARLDAARRVGQARSEAILDLRAVGIDPARVELGAGPVGVGLTIGPPPDAARLWQRVRGPAQVAEAPHSGRPAPTSASSMPTPPPPSMVSSVSGLGAAATDPSVLAEPPSAALQPMGVGVPTATLVDAVTSIPGSEPQPEGQVFELFWEKMPSDRRVRSRLRRRVGREGA